MPFHFGFASAVILMTLIAMQIAEIELLGR